MKEVKGFTLVELIIVIVIVAILSIVAIPIYRGYVEKSKLTEAKALTGSVLSAQRIYFAEHGGWYILPSWSDYDDVLSVDARSYKFFNKINTDISRDRYPGTVKAGARSDSENIEVYQYWPLLQGGNVKFPKWVIINAAGEVKEEW